MACDNNIKKKFKIREMVFEDVYQVLKIEKVSFSSPWSEKIFQNELRSPISVSYVAVSECPTPEVIGYINFWIVADELHLNNVAVHPEQRGTGIASALLERMLRTGKAEGAARATLEVRVSNSTAVRLYEKFGFSVMGRRPRYYSDTNEDALIMWADIPYI